MSKFKKEDWELITEVVDELAESSQKLFKADRNEESIEIFIPKNEIKERTNRKTLKNSVPRDLAESISRPGIQAEPKNGGIHIKLQPNELTKPMSLKDLKNFNKELDELINSENEAD